MNHIIKLFLIAVAIVTAIPSFAVSQQEMEQARAMAAKHYLRYANNGSDYLDKINPSSVAELSKSLKAKEQENIKAFNAIALPKDYASWDKAKLVDYWSNTFFKSAGLKEDGKKCLGILAKNLAKIEVSAKPEQKQSSAVDKSDNAATSNTSDPSNQSNSTTPSAPSSPSNPSEASAESLDPTAQALDAESAAVAAESAQEESFEEERPRKSSGTGWYIAILVILIGVVVWLVMYAQKSMKESGQIVAGHKESEKEVREAKRNAKEEINKMRDQYAASIAAKNEEIKQLRERCSALEEELERAQDRAAVHSVPVDKPAAKPTPSRQPTTDNRQPTTDNRQLTTDNRQPKTSLPPVVFLSYVNQRGLFVKASRSLNAESSVYRMDIPDGMHGSFRVVNDPSILDRLLSDPAMWLEGGCDIDNPEDADIATEIVTLAAGEALFSDNTCRVVRKARIKFI